MEYPDYEIAKIKNFFDACNEMIEGKFILSDIKISKILKCIANSELLYNLFREVLNNFKFKEEFANAKSSSKVNGSYFIMPKEDDKIIALVFCILLEVDNQKMNLQNFVNEYFYNSQGYNISYSNFALTVLIPFKDAVIRYLACNTDGTPMANEEEFESEEVSDESEEIITKTSEPNSKQKILFANLKMSLNELLSVILRCNKIKDEQKEELQIIINALHEAILIENLKIINALIIPLEYMIGKNKFVKFYYNDFKECLVQFYYE